MCVRIRALGSGVWFCEPGSGGWSPGTDGLHGSGRNKIQLSLPF